MTRLTNDNRSPVKEHVNAHATIRQNWLWFGDASRRRWTKADA
jgi:hypothetical protein